MGGLTRLVITQSSGRPADQQKPDMEFDLTDIVDVVDGNGYYLLNNYVPEDVLIVILSYLKNADVLNCRRTCKTWNRIIKSHAFWNEIFVREYGKPAKRLPWYVLYTKVFSKLFDTNLIKNGNGELKFDYWVINPVFSGDGFALEAEPQGAQPLPLGIAEFNNRVSCFATSFGMCSKQQIIKLKDNKLHKHIINTFKPTIVASEWFAPRFDCSCIYKMIVNIVQSNGKFKHYEDIRTELQWTEGVWKKVEIIMEDYPDDVDYIVFRHEGQDMLYWKGHYGSKMAGACLKFIFESIDDTPPVQIEQ